MFESKTWYIEVTILTVISFAIEFAVGFAIGLALVSMDQVYLLQTNIFTIYEAIIAVAIFTGLAIWRIRKKALSVKEVVSLFLISFGINYGMSFLFPSYIQIPLSIGLVYLIIWRIHMRSVGKSRYAGTEITE
jgi:hypothetical protein